MPNRESPCSSGGLLLATSSALSSISRIVLTAGLRSLSRTAEIGVSITESVRPKTKARRSLYVGDARKISWSLGERIRLVGFLKVMADRSGDVGRVGVSGTGSGFEEGAARRRGWSLGSRSRRSGIPADGRLLGISVSVALGGILKLLMLMRERLHDGAVFIEVLQGSILVAAAPAFSALLKNYSEKAAICFHCRAPDPQSFSRLSTSYAGGLIIFLELETCDL